MPTYLVESYLPETEAHAAGKLAALLASASGGRHRWSLVLPEEDICLHVLDGPSADAIHDATLRAELRCQRISQVVLISPDSPDPSQQGVSP